MSEVKLRLDEETKARWVAAAAARGLDLTKLIKQAVERDLSSPPPLKPIVLSLPSRPPREFKPDFKKGQK